MTAPLPEPPPREPLSDPYQFDDALDCYLSYYAAVRAIGERVKAGMPVPEFMRSKREP